MKGPRFDAGVFVAARADLRRCKYGRPAERRSNTPCLYPITTMCRFLPVPLVGRSFISSWPLFGQLWQASHRRVRPSSTLSFRFPSTEERKTCLGFPRPFVVGREQLACYDGARLFFLADTVSLRRPVIPMLRMPVAPSGLGPKLGCTGLRTARVEEISKASSGTAATPDLLDQIHAHGIYHRDLKPENIMLRSAGAPAGVGHHRFLHRQRPGPRTSRFRAFSRSRPAASFYGSGKCGRIRRFLYRHP